MKIYNFHYSGEYSTHPDEDVSLHKNGWFAVFDGVTLEHQDPYPDPSPAAQAAQDACGAVVNTRFDFKNPTSSISQASHRVNSIIRELNNSLGITEETVNFLSVQYAATVGAFAYVSEGWLYGAQINDSELAVLNSDGSFKFRLNTVVGPVNELLAVYRREGKFSADSADEYKFVRKHIVNNTSLEFKGQQIRFGVLTGQMEAEYFLNSGAVELSADDTVLLYSDGMIPYIEDEVFRSYLAANPGMTDFDKRQYAFEAPERERTIIIIKGPYD